MRRYARQLELTKIFTDETGASETSIPATRHTRDKWVEIAGDFVPETVPHWTSALGAIDRAERMSTVAPKHYTGYRFPDPGMLVFSEGRRERNLFNWLLIRDASVHRLMHNVTSEHGIPRGFSNELWRMILGAEFTDEDKMAAASKTMSMKNLPNARTSAHSDRRRAAIAIFGQPPDAHNHQEVVWRGHKVPWGTFFQHDPRLVQEVLWDVHQHSFQFDVVAIDQYLCPSLWKTGSTMRQKLISTALGCENCFIVGDVPHQDLGIASSDDERCMAAYHALSELMRPWPPTSGPPYTTDTPSAYKAAVARRFCQAFCKAFGRPPILPKLIPQGNSILSVFPYKR